MTDTAQAARARPALAPLAKNPPGAAIETVRRALRDHGRTLSTDGRQAQCPAHPDRNPSLSISRADQFDGVLLKCHTGCAIDDILKALNLTRADLFDNPRDKANGSVLIATYPYTDAAGNLLFEKRRYFPKTFSTSPAGAVRKLDRKPLYRLPEVLQASSQGRTIYLVEGEKDADAICALGHLATCNYDGAGKFNKPEYADYLSGANVVIIADRDQAGYRHAEQAKALLEGQGIPVTLKIAATGKDASDHLAAGHSLDQLDDYTPMEGPGPDQPAPGTNTDAYTAGLGFEQAEAEHQRRRTTGEQSDGPEKQSAATVITLMALDDYHLGTTTSGDHYAVPRTGPRIVRMLRGGKGSLRAELARKYLSAHGKVASQQALTDAITALEGAAQEQDPTDLHLRIAEADGHHWYDLGDQTGRAVRINADGWTITDTSPALFRRTELTAPMPDPEPGGTLDELWRFVNISPEDRPLLLAYMVAAFFENIPHPVMALEAEHGSAKSSTARTIAMLTDPSSAPLRKVSRDADSWVTAAAGSWVVTVDNVSTIPDWFSDALCRASTGEGDVRRKLYTDGGLSVVSFRRCTILTGIDLGGLRGDLTDRLLRINLRRIDDTARLGEKELDAEWEAARPRIFGALLDLVAATLQALPCVRLERKARLADFHRILAAVDEVLGTRGQDRYLKRAKDIAADTIQAEPFMARLIEQITYFHGTSATLHARIMPDTRNGFSGKDWPKGARQVTTLLRRNAPALRSAGWTVEQDGNDRENKLLWQIKAPQDDAGVGVAGNEYDPSPGAGEGAGENAGETSYLQDTGTFTCTNNPASTGNAGNAGVAGNKCEQSQGVPAGDAGGNAYHPLLSLYQKEGEPCPPEIARTGHLQHLQGPPDTTCPGCGATLTDYMRTTYGRCFNCANSDISEADPGDGALPGQRPVVES